MALESYDDVVAGLRGPGSVGRISPNSKWKIVDAEGQDVVSGSEGEILGQPPERKLVTADGETTLEVDADGWYHTGDVGRVDENGILYITGRLKEMMIVGGFNVFPAEIEDVLRELALVRDAVVVGVPDERLGEIPNAGIVWNVPPNHGEDREKAVASLISHSRSRLAAYKVPRRWVDLGELPLTPNGKLDRRTALRLVMAQSR
jgi:long-chain acyl-CoA synthetase